MASRHNLIINNAKLLFKNFQGKGSKFNAEGNRNFCVIIDPETAERLAADGWNVKWTKPSSDEYDPEPFIKVNVSYKKKAPEIVLIKGNTVVKYGEAEVNNLEWTDLRNVDLRITGSRVDRMDGTSGYSGYLDAMYINIEEDELDRKYAHLFNNNEEEEF